MSVSRLCLLLFYLLHFLKKYMTCSHITKTKSEISNLNSQVFKWSYFNLLIRIFFKSAFLLNFLLFLLVLRNFIRLYLESILMTLTILFGPVHMCVHPHRKDVVVGQHKFLILVVKIQTHHE